MKGVALLFNVLFGGACAGANNILARPITTHRYDDGVALPQKPEVIADSIVRVGTRVEVAGGGYLSGKQGNIVSMYFDL